MSSPVLKNNFLDEVEKFVNKKLNRREDIDVLIKNYFVKKDPLEFDDFTFLGKYVSGLFRVLMGSGKVSEFQNLEQVKKDLGDNIDKVTSLLREITFSLNEDCKTQIEKNYLELSNKSLQNLQQLVEDLDRIKKYLNYLKRK